MTHASLSVTRPVFKAPTWPGVFQVLKSCKTDLVEVPLDGDGIVSSSLREILENWPQGKAYPKYLYTIPYGCNPTGKFLIYSARGYYTMKPTCFTYYS